MGRKGNWFHSMKKANGSESTENQDLIPSKSKKKWFSMKKKLTYPMTITTSSTTTTTAVDTDPAATPAPQPSPAVVAPSNSIPSSKEKAEEDVKSNSQGPKTEGVDQSKQRVASKAAPVASSAAAPTTLSGLTGKPKEEEAAIMIQTAFRVYLAKRALRALRGLSRLKHMLQSPSMKRQTGSTLKSMQTLARVQSQIRAQRVRMSQENQARQLQLQTKQAKQLEKNLQNNGDDWDLSVKSKDQIQARMDKRHEAAIRRERAMAYSFNHQQTWRSSTTPKSSHDPFTDSTNPHWGWSWLERWLAARPWETADIYNSMPDFASLKPSFQNPNSRGSHIAKALLYHVSYEKPSPPSTATSSPRAAASPRSAGRRQNTRCTTLKTTPGRHSTSTPPSNSNSKPKPTKTTKARSPAEVSSSSTTRSKTKKPAAESPRKSATLSCAGDDDARSVLSGQSEQQMVANGNIKGHLSACASSAGGDDVDSLASSPTIGSMVNSVPSYMAATESAKARSRLGGSPSTAGEANKQDNSNDRSSVSSAKKRISYPSSPAQSRRSISSITDANSMV